MQNLEKILQFAIEVVFSLDDYLSTWVPATSYSQSKPDVFQKFWHIAIDDVNRSNLHGCHNILGSSNFHSIYSIFNIDPTLLMARDLACLCPPYVMEEWETCQNRFQVLPWWLIKFKPNKTKLVRKQMQKFEE